MDGDQWNQPIWSGKGNLYYFEGEWLLELNIFMNESGPTFILFVFLLGASFKTVFPKFNS